MKRLMQWQAHKKLNGNRESGSYKKKKKMKKENGKNGGKKKNVNKSILDICVVYEWSKHYKQH